MAFTCRFDQIAEKFGVLIVNNFRLWILGSCPYFPPYAQGYTGYKKRTIFLCGRLGSRLATC